MIKFKKLAVCVLGITMAASTVSGVSISLGGAEVKAADTVSGYVFTGYKQFTDSDKIQRHYQEYTRNGSTYAFYPGLEIYGSTSSVASYANLFTTCTNDGSGKCAICGNATTNATITEGTLYCNMREITAVNQLKDNTRYLFLNGEYSSDDAFADLPNGAGLIETISLVGRDGSVTLSDSEIEQYGKADFTYNTIDEWFYDGDVIDPSGYQGTPYVGDLDVAAFVKTIIPGSGFDLCEYGVITLQSGYALSNSASILSTDEYIYSGKESEKGSGWLYGCVDFFEDCVLTSYSRLYTYETKTYDADDIYVVLNDGKTIPDKETTITTDDLTVVIKIDDTTYDIPSFTILEKDNTVSKDDHNIMISVGGVIKNVTFKSTSNSVANAQNSVKTGYTDYTWMWAAFIVACAGISAFALTNNKKRKTN